MSAETRRTGFCNVYQLVELRLIPFEILIFRLTNLSRVHARSSFVCVQTGGASVEMPGSVRDPAVKRRPYRFKLTYERIVVVLSEVGRLQVNNSITEPTSPEHGV